MITLLQANPYEGMSGQEAGMMAAMGTGMLLFALVAYLFYSFCLYKIFQKAGRQDAWAAFIPIYNNFVLADIVKKPVWFAILMCIPYINIIFAIWALNRLSKVFGQTEIFTVGLVLLSFIFLPLLAFGNYQYNGDLVTDDRK